MGNVNMVFTTYHSAGSTCPETNVKFVNRFQCGEGETKNLVLTRARYYLPQAWPK